MYCVSSYDYVLKNMLTVKSCLSHYDACEYAQDILLSFIVAKQGHKIEYEHLFYPSNIQPEFRGSEIYYIRKSLTNPNKFTVVQLKRHYGYVYNSLIECKHLVVYVSHQPLYVYDTQLLAEYEIMCDRYQQQKISVAEMLGENITKKYFWSDVIPELMRKKFTNDQYEFKKNQDSFYNVDVE